MKNLWKSIIHHLFLQSFVQHFCYVNSYIMLINKQNSCVLLNIHAEQLQFVLLMYATIVTYNWRLIYKFKKNKIKISLKLISYCKTHYLQCCYSEVPVERILLSSTYGELNHDPPYSSARQLSKNSLRNCQSYSNLQWLPDYLMNHLVNLSVIVLGRHEVIVSFANSE